MQQLVEEYLFIGLHACGQGQDGPQDTAHKGGGQAGDLHGSAYRQIIPLRHPLELGECRRFAFSQDDSQPEIGEGVARQEEYDARRV